MSVWLVLLAPVVLAPIVLLFAFVGCGIDTTGQASPPTTRVMLLHYESIPKLSTPIVGFNVLFSASSGSVSPTWFQHDVAWQDGVIEPDVVPSGGGEFQASSTDEVVECTCTVTVVPSNKWPGSPGYLEPIPLDAVPAKTKHAVVDFMLTYPGWPSGDYEKPGFELVTLD